MNYSSRFGQEAPDEQIITLTSVYVKRDLYDVYTEESPKPHVKKSSFYYLYRKYFGPHKEYSLTPTVRITKYSNHSCCDLCVTIRQLRVTVRSPWDLQEIGRHTELHRKSRRC